MKNDKLTLYYIFAFVAMVSMGLIKPIIPIILREQNISAFYIGLITSLFMIFRAISASVNGYLWDKNVNFTLLIRIGILILSIILFIYFPFHSLFTFLILRPIQGYISGMMWPIIQIDTIIQAKDNSNKAISFYFISGNFGGIIGIFLSALFIYIFKHFFHIKNDLLFMPYFFIFSSLLFFVLFILSKNLTLKNKVEKKQSNIPLNRANNTISFYSLLIIIFINGLIISLLNSIIIIYFKEEFHLSSLYTTLLYGTLVGISLFFMYKFNATLTKNNWKLKSVILYVVLSLILLLFFIQMNNLILLFLIIFIFIITKINVPLSRNLLKILCTKSFGKRMGYLNTSQNLGVFLGGMLNGYIYDHFTNKLLGLGIFGILMGLATLYFILTTSKIKKMRENY